jgi:hypothetical protein
MSKQQENMGNYSTEDLLRYAAGQMDAEAMHRMERAALDDDLLADAMEGYRAMVQQGRAQDIEALLAALPAPTADAPTPPASTPVVRMHWLRRVSYAAAAVLLLGTGWWIYSLQGPAYPDESTEATKAVAREVPPAAEQDDMEEDAPANIPPVEVAKNNASATAAPKTAAPPQAAPPPVAAPQAADLSKNNAIVNVPIQAERIDKDQAATESTLAGRDAARSIARQESRKMVAAPAMATPAASGISIAAPDVQLLPVPTGGWDALLPQLKRAAGNHTLADSLQLRFSVQPGGTVHKLGYEGRWSEAGKAAVQALLIKSVPFALATQAEAEVVLYWY